MPDVLLPVSRAVTCVLQVVLCVMGIVVVVVLLIALADGASEPDTSAVPPKPRHLPHASSAHPTVFGGGDAAPIVGGHVGGPPTRPAAPAQDALRATGCGEHRPAPRADAVAETLPTPPARPTPDRVAAACRGAATHRRIVIYAHAGADPPLHARDGTLALGRVAVASAAAVGGRGAPPPRRSRVVTARRRAGGAAARDRGGGRVPRAPPVVGVLCAAARGGRPRRRVGARRS